MRRVLYSLAAAGICCLSIARAAEQTEDETVNGVFSRFSDLKLPTLGGVQYWSDVLLFRDWRIQRNAVTGHFRLLDGDNIRHAWGSFERCNQRLARIKRDEKLAPMSGKAVLLLHGLGRTRNSFKKMAVHLSEEGGYTVLSAGYPSTQADVAAHANDLRQILSNLDGVEEINIVAHSLGNITVRHYLADAAARGEEPDPRIGRMVMLAPPNNGSRLAEKIGQNRIFELILGATGGQLAGPWQELERRLATPDFEFGIIAGNGGGNPLLNGEDDLVVSVATTKLRGARDFVVVDAKHTFIMNSDQVLEYTLRFLQEGHFISEEMRKSIEAPAATNALE